MRGREEGWWVESSGKADRTGWLPPLLLWGWVASCQALTEQDCWGQAVKDRCKLGSRAGSCCCPREGEK